MMQVQCVFGVFVDYCECFWQYCIKFFILFQVVVEFWGFGFEVFVGQGLEIWFYCIDFFDCWFYVMDEMIIGGVEKFVSDGQYEILFCELCKRVSVFYYGFV